MNTLTILKDAFHFQKTIELKPEIFTEDHQFIKHIIYNTIFAKFHQDYY